MRAARALVLTVAARARRQRPLYRDLFAWGEQSAVAVKTFTAREANYHPICAKMLRQDLKL